MFLLVTVSIQLFGQCPYNAAYPNFGTMDPPGVGQTTTFNNFASGGEHYTLNATSGCVYTVSMCGTSWDTQLTIFDETNADVAYNDDSSCGLASEVTFTATSTGAYTIQLNNYFCNTNFTVAEYFGVTLVSCAATGGCNDPSACNYNAGDTDATNCCYDDECITLTAGGGSWDGEISWTVTDGTGAQVAGGPANSPGGVEVCLPDGCYTVNYFDSFGDGWNGATFTVTNGGNTIFTGTLVGGFGGSEQFCIELIPPEPPCYETEDTGCPSIDAGADIIIPECPTPCENVTVTADVFESGGTESYRVCSIDYNPPYPFNVGTPVFVGADDLFSGVVPLPFDFCFYENTFNQLVIGANGLITFDVSLANQTCSYDFFAQIPTPSAPAGLAQYGIYNNSINGAYHDIDPSDPSFGGTISYAVLGSAPCRTFVVNFNDVPHFFCTTLTTSQQIVLYETTNAIEVYIENKPTCVTWNDGNAVIGLQNATGTQGIVPPGRQTGPWSAANEAWRFTPDGAPNFSVEWFDQGGSIGTGTSIDICPSENSSIIVARATYTRCDGTAVVVEDDKNIICSVIMLPVEWLDFDAKLINNESQTRCTWSTASEMNNDFFTVQRTVDGYFWEDIGMVDGSGTTAETQHYSFIDSDPLYGVSYYRILQTDFNGDQDVSEKRAVERMHRLSFNAFPNPSDGTYVLSGVEGGLIKVYDVRGREMPFTLSDANELTLIDASQGCYIVELRHAFADRVKRLRLVVR